MIRNVFHDENITNSAAFTQGSSVKRGLQTSIFISATPQKHGISTTIANTNKDKSTSSAMKSNRKALVDLSSSQVNIRTQSTPIHTSTKSLSSSTISKSFLNNTNIRKGDINKQNNNINTIKKGPSSNTISIFSSEIQTQLLQPCINNEINTTTYETSGNACVSAELDEDMICAGLKFSDVDEDPYDYAVRMSNKIKVRLMPTIESGLSISDTNSYHDNAIMFNFNGIEDVPPYYCCDDVQEIIGTSMMQCDDDLQLLLE